MIVHLMQQAENNRLNEAETRRQDQRFMMEMMAKVFSRSGGGGGGTDSKVDVSDAGSASRERR